MINKITGEASMVGFNGALETLPFLLLGPHAGVLADRVDRRKIMLVSDIVCALVLLLLAAVVLLNGKPPVEAILATSTIASCARAHFHPARNAAVPRLTPEGRVLEANAFSAMTFNFVFMAGLALSAVLLGVLYSSLGSSFYLYAVALNALSFLGSALFVVRLPSLEPERDALHEESHVLRDVKDGLRYLKGRHELKILFLIGLISNLMVAPFFPVYVKANQLWFGDMPQTLTWFECSFFVGMVIAGAYVAKAKVRAAGWGNIVGLLVCGLTVALMAYFRTIPWWCALNFAAGLALPFAWIPSDTYLQVSVPDSYRGRVQSLKTMISNGAQPIGLTLGGVIIDRLGLVFAFLLMGGGMAMATLVGLLDRPFRTLRVEEEAFYLDKEKAEQALAEAEPA